MNYYDVNEDIEKYPEAWILIIYSKRGPGKTYSSLRKMIEENIHFIFMKRTIDDVKILCNGSSKIGNKVNNYGLDLSPFKPLNRDFGWNIKIFTISDGFAGFWRCDDENNPIGSPLGYCLAISAVAKYKGFDLSECDYMIFDEFIPKRSQRISRTEGEDVLDLYMTVSRDRIKRGKPELKLLALANAEQLNNQLMMTLEVLDIAADMNITGKEYTYIENRHILMHQIPEDKYKGEDDTITGIEMAMRDTAWGETAFGGKFGYEDFSNIGHVNLKGYKPYTAFRYKHTDYFIYMKDGQYYGCTAKNDKVHLYNLNRENDQKKFFYDYAIDLRNECIDGNMIFENFIIYDIIINYKQFFKI